MIIHILKICSWWCKIIHNFILNIKEQKSIVVIQSLWYMEWYFARTSKKVLTQTDVCNYVSAIMSYTTFQACNSDINENYVERCYLSCDRIVRKNYINPLSATLPSYRKESIDLHSKSIDWFLYEGNTGT